MGRKGQKKKKRKKGGAAAAASLGGLAVDEDALLSPSLSKVKSREKDG